MASHHLLVRVILAFSLKFCPSSKAIRKYLLCHLVDVEQRTRNIREDREKSFQQPVLNQKSVKNALETLLSSLRNSSKPH